MWRLHFAVTLLAIACGVDRFAIGQQDPRVAQGQRAVRDILQRVGDELLAIDQMLMEAARPAAAETVRRDRATELLHRSDEAQTRVADGIDELLKEIEARQGDGC